MNEAGEYLAAAQEFAKAQARMRDLYKVVSQVGRSIEGSNRYDFAKRQSGDKLIAGSLYSPKETYMDWPSEHELLDALKSYREAADKALELFGRVPDAERAGLKRIEPRERF
jgi:hypothetical protein